MRLQTRSCKIASEKQAFVKLKRMMQHLMIHLRRWKMLASNSLIWRKHLKMSLLKMSQLLMTCLCQHRSHLADFLPIDAHVQHESDDEEDSQSEVSKVLVKSNPLQLRASVDTLMN